MLYMAKIGSMHKHVQIQKTLKALLTRWIPDYYSAALLLIPGTRLIYDVTVISSNKTQKYLGQIPGGSSQNPEISVISVILI